MSARNFYQTFYQQDPLFRLTGESWATITPTVPTDRVPETDDTPDLLVELARLSAASVPAESVPAVADTLLDEPIAIPVPAAPPEPVVRASVPEPLPEPPARPATPSVLPPVRQQPRLPQLNHKVLLLADEELDPSNLLFLEKILNAVNLNINGVDLLNLHGVQDLDFPELLRGKYINHFITFGVPFERIQLDIMMDRYAPVRFEGITFLMADSLPTIEADHALKKRLWGALQRVFLQR